MDDLRHRSIGVGQQLKQRFVGAKRAGLQDQRRDGYEFVLSLVVVDERVKVKGIDDVGNGQDLKRVLKLRRGAVVAGSLGADQGGQGVNELLLAVDGL